MASTFRFQVIQRHHTFFLLALAILPTLFTKAYQSGLVKLPHQALGDTLFLPRRRKLFSHLCNHYHNTLLLGSYQNRRCSTAILLSLRATANNFGEESTAASSGGSNKELDSLASKVGLYRSFAELTCQKLQETGWLTEQMNENDDLRHNLARTKGRNEHDRVRLTTKSFLPRSDDSPIRLARYALLETVSTNESLNYNSSNSSNLNSASAQASGVQVLNFVIFPSLSTSLPVWGADLVSLPPGKHLLLLDAQPMIPSSKSKSSSAIAADPYSSAWKQWYHQHVANSPYFPWGGDLPEPIKRFVSPHALWTRLSVSHKGGAGVEERKSTNGDPDMDAVECVQGPFFQAFAEHLDIYINLLRRMHGNEPAGENDQSDYIAYRLANDPARPMLKALYGEEYTERLLQTVLFPQPF